MNNFESITTKFPNITYTHLGAQDLIVSDIGFGSYRIDNETDEHYNALKSAIKSGINLIDTSTNYTDGSSETLIGRVIEDCEREGISRNNLVVVSKAGYLQGSTLEHSRQRKSQGISYPELVEFSDQLEHCIHPQFLEDQLERSLRRLNLTYIDVFLLHNPEYYLQWASEKGMSHQKAQETYYSRIQNAFNYLEKQVENGRIRYYGVSSNTLQSSSTDYTHTSLTTLLDCAKKTSETHHFSVIQCPMNLAETEAKTNAPSVLEIAEKNGVGVLINRPLNAIIDQKLIRLIDYDCDTEVATLEVEDLIQELVEFEMDWESFEIASTELPENIQNVVKNYLSMGTHLQEYWASFSGLEHWKDVMTTFIIPRVEKAIEILSNDCVLTQYQDEWLRNYVEYLNLITKNISLYYKAYASARSESIKYQISQAIPNWAQNHKLSHIAIQALRQTPGVTSILVGMRQEQYVEDIVSIAKQKATKSATVEDWKKASAILRKDTY